MAHREFWFRACEVANACDEQNLIPGMMLYDENWARWLCPCGCERRVLIPIDSDEEGQRWRLSVQGLMPTITPSINSVGFACKSHYFIRNGHVEWV